MLTLSSTNHGCYNDIVIKILPRATRTSLSPFCSQELHTLLASWQFSGALNRNFNYAEVSNHKLKGIQFFFYLKQYCLHRHCFNRVYAPPGNQEIWETFFHSSKSQGILKLSLVSGKIKGILMRSYFSCTNMSIHKIIVIESVLFWSKTVTYIICLISLSHHGLNGCLNRKLSQYMTQACSWCLLM